MDRIDDNSVAVLHEAFVTAREEFEAAVRAADGRWEEKILEPEDGGDEAWPPHMAAAHALLGERWRFRYITLLLDQSPDREPLSHEAFGETQPGQEELAARRERYNARSDAAATVEAAAREWPAIDAVYDRLSDSDLGRPAGLSDGQLNYLESMGQAPSNDLRGCLLLAVVHLCDHAHQLREAMDG